MVSSIKNKKKAGLIFSIVLIALIFIFSFFGRYILKLRGSVVDVLSGQNNIISMKVENSNFEIQNSKYTLNVPFENDTKKVTMEINLNDETKYKKIKINLKEGLNYKTFPSFETESDGKNIILFEKKPEKIYNGVYLNEVDANYSTFGDLEYVFDSGVKKITFSFNVSIDLFKFYGPKLIKDAISVNLYTSDKVTNDIYENMVFSNSIDSINCDINVTTQETNFIKFETRTDHFYNTNILASSSENNVNGKRETYGYTKFSYTSLSYYFGGSKKMYNILPFYKKAIYELHYPQHTILDSVVIDNKLYQEGTTEDQCIKIENVSTANMVKITINNEQNNCYVYSNTTGIGVKYMVDYANNIEGLFQDQNITSINEERNNKLTVTYYDDTEKVYANDTLDNNSNLLIRHPDNFKNVLTIQSTQDMTEDGNDETYIYGPVFTIHNDTSWDKTDQVFEFNTDEDYQAIAVQIPKNKGAEVLEVLYQTTDSLEWVSYKGDFASQKENTIFRITISDLGIPNKYLKGMKIVVDRYPENYFSSKAVPKSEVNAAVYGNLKADKESAEVTLKIFDKNNNANITSATAKVVKSELASVQINNSNSINFRKIENNQPITTTKTNDEIAMGGTINLFSYPYGTRMYLEDIQIYIRQPKGITIGINNLKLLDNDNNNVEYRLSSRLNTKGDTVYVVSTNYDVGKYLSKEDALNKIERILKINVPFIIDNSYGDNQININELIYYWGEDSTFIPHEKVQCDEKNTNCNKDINDINANDDIEETISNISSKTLTIQPINGFILSSFITKDGKSYLPYNSSNYDTILELYPNDNFEYNVKVKNNTESNISDYELYIPIPKKNTNYGDKFQLENFNWDIELLELVNSANSFEISYSTDSNKGIITNPFDLSYKSNNIDLSDVTVVKIKAKETIMPGEEFVFQIKMKVSDNNISDDSLKLNIWNAVVNVISANLEGEFNSNKVATKLFAPSLKGMLYLDLNKNKKYDEGIDIPGVLDSEAELYKLEEEEYKKVKKLNINPISGKFELDDIKELRGNTYAIKLNSEKFELYSDITSDGWIKNLTFENGEGYYYEIGYITDEFAPSIKAEDAYIYVGDKIEFETYIKEAYDYKKEKIEFVFGEKGNTTYSSDIPNNNGIATKVGIYYTTYEVTDKYGNKASVLTKIYVRERPVSPSTNDDITKYIIIGILSLVAIILSAVLLKNSKKDK